MTAAEGGVLIRLYKPITCIKNRTFYTCRQDAYIFGHFLNISAYLVDAIDKIK